MSNRYNYYGLHQIDLPRDERGYYQRFMVFRGGKCLIDFYTNKDFEGMFVKRNDGTYQQTAGTCQFTLAHSSESAARSHLRKLAIKAEENGIRQLFGNKRYASEARHV